MASLLRQELRNSDYCVITHGHLSFTAVVHASLLYVLWSLQGCPLVVDEHQSSTITVPIRYVFHIREKPYQSQINSKEGTFLFPQQLLIICSFISESISLTVAVIRILA